MTDPLNIGYFLELQDGPYPIRPLIYNKMTLNNKYTLIGNFGCVELNGGLAYQHTAQFDEPQKGYITLHAQNIPMNNILWRVTQVLKPRHIISLPDDGLLKGEFPSLSECLQKYFRDYPGCRCDVCRAAFQRRTSYALRFFDISPPKYAIFPIWCACSRGNIEQLAVCECVGWTAKPC